MAAVLAGLFPPKDTALEWNRKLNWQPIPIFSEPLDEDTVWFFLYLPVRKLNMSLPRLASFGSNTMSSLL